jgi:hypothetical protein
MIDSGCQEVRTMQIKDCSCPGRAEEKPVALTCAIVAYCGSHRGGRVASVSDYLHGTLQQAEKLVADLYEALGDVPPTGKAVITDCSECRGRGCSHCGDSGKELWRDCPKCGDIGFGFINGRDESPVMGCRIGCGFRWAADDPRWLAQRLPARTHAA